MEDEINTQTQTNIHSLHRFSLYKYSQVHKHTEMLLRGGGLRWAGGSALRQAPAAVSQLCSLYTCFHTLDFCCTYAPDLVLNLVSMMLICCVFKFNRSRTHCLKGWDFVVAFWNDVYFSWIIHNINFPHEGGGTCLCVFLLLLSFLWLFNNQCESLFVPPPATLCSATLPRNV